MDPMQQQAMAQQQMMGQNSAQTGMMLQALRGMGQPPGGQMGSPQMGQVPVSNINAMPVNPNSMQGGMGQIPVNQISDPAMAGLFSRIPGQGGQ